MSYSNNKHGGGVDLLPPAVRRSYPFSSHWHTISIRGAGSGAGFRMHYLDEGRSEGPVVVCLHGNPTWSFYFRDLVRDLVAQGFRCIVPDHLGCGLSDKPSRGYDYTLANRVSDIEPLIDALRVESFSLVVRDWGGAIGMGVATERPLAVKRIVAMNTAAFRSQAIPKRIAVCKLPLIGPLLVRGFNAFAGPAVRMAVVRPLAREVAAGYLFPYRSWRDRRAVSEFVRDIPLRPSHRSYATLTRIEQGLAQLADKPVFLPWGARDFCFSTDFLREWQRFFPKARVHCMAKCGHYLLEDGGAPLRTKIVEFLSGDKS